MKAKHTSGPWKVKEWTYGNGRESFLTIEGPTDAIARTHLLYRPQEPHTRHVEEEIANAEFIVRAVNSHDELVEALQNLHDACEYWENQNDPVLADARKAIANAERGSE